MSLPGIRCTALLLLCLFLSMTSQLAGQEAGRPPADELPPLDLEEPIPQAPTNDPTPSQEESPEAEPEQPEEPVQEELQPPSSREEESTPPTENSTAQERGRTYESKRDSDSIFYYTYLGPSISAGFNSINFVGWHEGAHQEFTDSGWFTQPGGSCFIHVEPIIAQVDLGFRLNFNDTDATSCHHTRISVKGKYMHKTFQNLLLGGGGGLYFESIPATTSYDGAGLLLCASAAYTLSSSWMVLFDCDFGFGTFGIGEESTKIEYGITIGAGKKMGNL